MLTAGMPGAYRSMITAHMRQGGGTREQRERMARAGRAARPAERARAGEPLYQRVAQALKGDIVGGVYAVGSPLPTEAQLRRRFGISRHTVREALRRLREDDLVVTRQGAATVVIPRRAGDSYRHDVNSINDLVSWAAGRRFLISSIEMIRLDEALAARTGLTAGERWLAVRGFGHMEGATDPVCWAEYYIHRKFAAVGRLLQRHSGPIFPLIEDRFGQSVIEVHQEIGATLIAPALAQGLKVRPGAAALEVRRAYKLTNGDIAQVTISTHPAALFRHAMTMRRVKG